MIDSFGVVNVLKPPGVTSHDVVARMRRILGQRKVGHGGTLDPGAVGVLPILVGRATKLMPYLLLQRKCYRAEMTLGIATDTQDASGNTTGVASGFVIKPTALADAISTFIGEIEQVPPMASALRQGGKRLYELARAGETVERDPRPVTIDEIHVRAIWPPGSERLVAGSRVLLDILCSKGTYIRTLCHDIGRRLGCGAHMSFLVRTRVGPLQLADSLTLSEVEQAIDAGDPFLLPPGDVLVHLPLVSVDDEAALKLRQGQPQPARSGDDHSVGEDGLVRVMDDREALVCIARLLETPDGPLVQPVRVF